MKQSELIELLQRHIATLEEQRKQDSALISSLNDTISTLNATVESLKATIKSLEDAISGKDAEVEKEKAARKAMARLQGSKSERQKTAKSEPQKNDATAATEPESKKEERHTNNGAKRNRHLECETEIVEVDPEDPDFNPEIAKFLKYVEAVRYEVIPMKFVKKIYRQNKYLQNGKILMGKAPKTPLLNSNYTSSFIAGLAELRYLHGMPLEDAASYFKAHGFDLDEGTARKLLAKVKVQLENLYKAMAEAIIRDSYICGDETYHKVRLLEPNDNGSFIKKGYIWTFVGMNTGLVYFFYDEGSRKAEVFEEQIKGFKGAFQCDFYSCYRRLGIGEYREILRLPCIQHIKRKFNDIKDNPRAKEILDAFNLLYRFEHKHKIGRDGWTPEDHLQWRQRYSKIVLEKIHRRLLAVLEMKLPPDNPLLKAVNHALKQWDEIPRIFSDPYYRLDNNTCECIQRYISLARRRLVIGSHSGAEVAVLYQSLAVSCHRLKINVFDYFCDIIDTCASWPPNTPLDKYRDLLPDRWKPYSKR